MQDKRIVLGVSGGIAAYKACELASRLTQAGARVSVVMTESAQRFVTPLTFQALTHETVHTSLWQADSEGEHDSAAAMAHIGLAEKADAIVIAPASADIIARLAHGLSNDLLTTIALATRAPILVAPAMNPLMLAHPATQANLACLTELGYTVIEPESGHMACEQVGSGRLPETSVLIEALQSALSSSTLSNASWNGLTVLVTAGPTREAIDPVRFLTNRSSGKMGYAVAAAAARRGAHVLLVSGPTRLPAPVGVERIDVTTTAELYEQTTARAAAADIIVAAAAAADYRPREVATRKLKKTEGETERVITLVPTCDTLKQLGKDRRAGQILIGFAAETDDAVENARIKLEAKNCDAIVANDIGEPGAGFDVDTNRVTWVARGGAEEWPLLSKRDVAERICDQIDKLRGGAKSAGVS